MRIFDPLERVRGNLPVVAILLVASAFYALGPRAWAAAGLNPLMQTVPSPTPEVTTAPQPTATEREGPTATAIPPSPEPTDTAEPPHRNRTATPVPPSPTQTASAAPTKPPTATAFGMRKVLP